MRHALLTTDDDLGSRWIVRTITIVVGLFVAVVSSAWIWSHVVLGEDVDLPTPGAPHSHRSGISLGS